MTPLLALGMLTFVQPPQFQSSQTRYYRVVTASYAVEAQDNWDVQAPNIRATKWGIIDAVPPKLAGQDFISEIWVGGQKIESWLRNDDTYKRPVRIGMVKGKAYTSGLSFTTRYIGTLNRVVLKDLRPGQTAPSNALPPERVSADEERRCRASDSQMDWQSSQVQNLLAVPQLNLRFDPKRETSMAFAYRVHVTIAQLGHYAAESGDRVASRYAGQILSSGYFTGDCGSPTTLISALLRANGFLAEPLFGKRAKNQEPDGNGGIYACAHVRYRVYVPEVGWIVADPTDIMTGETDYLKTFTVDPGDLIVKHGSGNFVISEPRLSNDLIRCTFLQVPFFPVYGSGTFGGWQTQESWYATRRKIR